MASVAVKDRKSHKKGEPGHMTAGRMRKGINITESGAEPGEKLADSHPRSPCTGYVMQTASQGPHRTSLPGVATGLMPARLWLVAVE